eukprot:767012-Hanusia_phi.AAC.9
MGVVGNDLQEHDCRWQYNKLHWDLTPLVRHSPQRDYSVKRDNWEFYMNVCANTIKVSRTELLLSMRAEVVSVRSRALASSSLGQQRRCRRGIRPCIETGRLAVLRELCTG